MKKSSLILLGIFSVALANAQFHVGLFGGVAAYNGDLVDRIFPKHGTHPAFGITVNYELQDQIMIRAGVTYAKLGGADSNNKDAELIKRNLSFETKVFEFSLVGEYYLFNLYDRRYSPYFFAGFAVYHYN